MQELKQQPIALFWFRRDLRLHDNTGLYHALRSGLPVLPVFIFDTEILNKLHDRTDARVTFIYAEVQRLQTELRALGSDLVVCYGEPTAIFRDTLLRTYSIKAVYLNRDYEPYAQLRDSQIKTICNAQSINFHTFKDHVIFQYDEILKLDGTPYLVFTPYSKRWKQGLEMGAALRSFDTLPLGAQYVQVRPSEQQLMPTLSEIGFETSHLPMPDRQIQADILKTYHLTRDFPGQQDGTSRLGLHLRFGTVSIREVVREALVLNETYLNELIWRDFYAQILAHFPHVVERAFRPAYDLVPWRNAPAEFEAWCNGRTGYPLVDAGMRELNATGYMHNRVRMVVASFLTKHLLISWQLGEAYFAEKLLDFDLASNSGGWQWAAGCGTDAAPYFRVFNPTEQVKKFDSKHIYIKTWVPEYSALSYPQPMVEHVFARERCLAAYGSVLRNRH